MGSLQLITTFIEVSFYLFSIKERNPADPSGLIARSLAWDMGRVVLAWVDPAAARERGSSWGSVFGRKAF